MSIKKKINYIKKNTKLPSYVPLPSSMIGTGLSSSAMILYAELLNRASLSQKNDMTDEEMRQVLKDIERDGVRVTEILNDMLSSNN